MDCGEVEDMIRTLKADMQEEIDRVRNELEERINYLQDQLDCVGRNP